MAHLTIGPDFGYVVLVGAGIATHVVWTGLYVGAARRRVFNAEFHAKAKSSGLLEEHKKATGSDKLPSGGYPDMGNGRYAALLPYAGWLDLANAQRAHGNYVEGAASAITTLTLAGLFYPRAAALTGLAYMVGREIYSYFYINGGANKRMYGATILDIALIVNLGMALYGGYTLATSGGNFSRVVGM